MKRIRIFISSPGDVHEERERARGVVHQLRRRYADRFDLQAVLWEELPLQADMSFQQGIDVVLSESGVDIAVFILWSRLGSPLGPLVAREGGEPYRSGTEREWDLMLRARQRCLNEGSTPRPAIIVYTRNDDVSFEERLRGKPDDEKARDINQKLLVRQFIEEEFRDAETGTNIRAYHRFDQPTVFAKRLREHLTGLLDSIAGEGSSDPVWSIAEQGPPFRGLDVFEFEHGPIFFGREDEIVTIRARLRDQARQGCGFMLICGPSGSGKSSLARAGVVPDICSFEVDEWLHGWRRLAIKPASLGGNLLQGLVDSLIASDALPELGQWKSDVAVPADDDQFSSWLIRFQMRVMDALKSSRNATSSRSTSPLPTTPSKGQASTRLVLLVDQLEELFSNSSIQDEARERFFEALESLARCGQVWILATVRSDFYQHCQSIPALVRMKEGGGQFDLLPLTPDGLARVITGPAMLAGLTFERKGERVLSDAILTEGAEHKELLPLVEHLLLELCDHRTDDGMLTFDEFRRVGGVKGALRQRCEETFDRLSVGAQTCFDDVLSELVTLSGDGQENGVRRTVPQEQIATKADRRELIDAMVAARLFTATTGPDGNSAVSVAHEALLIVWPRIIEWINLNREFLRLRANVEQSCGRWLSNGSDPSLLLPEGLPLEEGRRLKELGQTRSDGQTCADGKTRVDKKTSDYIEHSETAAELHRRKATRRRRAVLATLSAATVILALLGVLANSFRSDAEQKSADLCKKITEVKGLLKEAEALRRQEAEAKKLAEDRAEEIERNRVLNLDERVQLLWEQATSEIELDRQAAAIDAVGRALELDQEHPDYENRKWAHLKRLAHLGKRYAKPEFEIDFQNEKLLAAHVTPDGEHVYTVCDSEDTQSAIGRRWKLADGTLESRDHILSAGVGTVINDSFFSNSGGGCCVKADSGSPSNRQVILGFAKQLDGDVKTFQVALQGTMWSGSFSENGDYFVVVCPSSDKVSKDAANVYLISLLDETVIARTLFEETPWKCAVSNDGSFVFTRVTPNGPQGSSLYAWQPLADDAKAQAIPLQRQLDIRNEGAIALFERSDEAVVALSGLVETAVVKFKITDGELDLRVVSEDRIAMEGTCRQLFFSDEGSCLGLVTDSRMTIGMLGAVSQEETAGVMRLYSVAELTPIQQPISVLDSASHVSYTETFDFLTLQPSEGEVELRRINGTVSQEFMSAQTGEGRLLYASYQDESGLLVTATTSNTVTVANLKRNIWDQDTTTLGHRDSFLCVSGIKARWFLDKVFAEGAFSAITHFPLGMTGTNLFAVRIANYANGNFENCQPVLELGLFNPATGKQTGTTFTSKYHIEDFAFSDKTSLAALGYRRGITNAGIVSSFDDDEQQKRDQLSLRAPSATVVVLNTDNGFSEICWIEGFGDELQSIDFSPTGKEMVIASHDIGGSDRLTFVNTESGQRNGEPLEIKLPLQRARYLKTGQLLVTTRNHTLLLLDQKQGKWEVVFHQQGVFGHGLNDEHSQIVFVKSSDKLTKVNLRTGESEQFKLPELPIQRDSQLVGMMEIHWHSSLGFVVVRDDGLVHLHATGENHKLQRNPIASYIDGDGVVFSQDLSGRIEAMTLRPFAIQFAEMSSIASGIVSRMNQPAIAKQGESFLWADSPIQTWIDTSVPEEADIERGLARMNVASFPKRISDALAGTKGYFEILNAAEANDIPALLKRCEAFSPSVAPELFVKVINLIADSQPTKANELLGEYFTQTIGKEPIAATVEVLFEYADKFPRVCSALSRKIRREKQLPSSNENLYEVSLRETFWIASISAANASKDLDELHEVCEGLQNDKAVVQLDRQLNGYLISTLPYYKHLSSVRVGDNDSASEARALALQLLDGGSPSTTMQRCAAIMATRDPVPKEFLDRVTREFEAIVENRDGDMIAKGYLGQLYLRLDRLNKAKALLETALSSEKATADFEPFAHHRSYLLQFLALAAAKQGDLKLATQHLADAKAARLEERKGRSLMLADDVFDELCREAEGVIELLR